MWLMLMAYHLRTFQLSSKSSRIITYETQKFFRGTLMARNDLFTPKLTKHHWCGLFRPKLIIVPCSLWSMYFVFLIFILFLLFSVWKEPNRYSVGLSTDRVRHISKCFISATYRGVLTSWSSAWEGNYYVKVCFDVHNANCFISFYV